MQQNFQSLSIKNKPVDNVVVQADSVPMTEDKIVALAEFVVVDLVGQHLFVVALLVVVVALDLVHSLAIPADFRVPVD